MQQVGKVISLFISNFSKREEQNSIEVDSRGIIDDKFYNKDINRSILITSIDSYKLATNKDIDINYGQLGENILTDYNPYNLAVGARLKIGDAILEITQNCTLCKSLSKIDSKLPKLLKDDRGIFAKVVKDGKLTKEDSIYLLNPKTT